MNRSLAARMGNSTSYRQSSPLSDDQMRAVAPSIFAAEAHASRSARYSYIPTIEVINGLKKEGFEPFMVAQGKTRVPGKADFTKHMLRLRHRSDIQQARANEIILINSHDGTSSYQMLGGELEFVCTNGLVCGDIMKDVRVKHAGDIVHDVQSGAFEILDGFGLIKEVIAEAEALQLTRPEQALFAEQALYLKYSDNTDADSEEPFTAPISAAQLLVPRRREDATPSLWHTFNRVQENVIRGGIPGRSGDNRRTRTREVTGIDTTVKLNRALWNLMQGMKDIKNGIEPAFV